jgi:hypothetical protein
MWTWTRTLTWAWIYRYGDEHENGHGHGDGYGHGNSHGNRNEHDSDTKTYIEKDKHMDMDMAMGTYMDRRWIYEKERWHVRIFFLYTLKDFFLHICCPSEASPRYCAIPDVNPPRNWQSLPLAGDCPDSNTGLQYCSQVRSHWATKPPKLNNFAFTVDNLGNRDSPTLTTTGSLNSHMVLIVP